MRANGNHSASIVVLLIILLSMFTGLESARVVSPSDKETEARNAIAAFAIDAATEECHYLSAAEGEKPGDDMAVKPYPETGPPAYTQEVILKEHPHETIGKIAYSNDVKYRKHKGCSPWCKQGLKGATNCNTKRHFDCSGLVWAAFKEAGFVLGRTTAATYARMSKGITVLQPGDLLFLTKGSVHHVGIYVGNNEVVHAWGKLLLSAGVEKWSLDDWNDYYGGANTITYGDLVSKLILQLDYYKLRRKVTRSPAAQLIEMTIGPPGGSDVWISPVWKGTGTGTLPAHSGMIRPSDIGEMDRQGKTMSSRAGFNYLGIGFNFRAYPLDDVNFRHALAHLVPKDRIIGTLFKYVVVKISTPVPPAQGEGFNPAVDDHPYSPAEAESTLFDAGYRKIAGIWRSPDGGLLPTLRLFTPFQSVAPTTYTIGRMLVDEARSIGLYNVLLCPVDFAALVDLVFNKWDFEMVLIHQNLGRFPTHLWHQFSSENNFLGSSNPHGITYPELDAELSTLWRSFDYTSTRLSALKAQELLMGGTPINPLPRNVPPEDPRSQALPVIPIYSKNIYEAQHPTLRGAVNMFGVGIANSWSLINMHWETPGNYRPGTSEKTIVVIEGEFPTQLNPLSMPTAYTWDCMAPTFEGLIAVNPYTHNDEGLLAYSWCTIQSGGGMTVKFWLKPNSYWQDGTIFDAYDVEFAWEFLRSWSIPAYWSWSRFIDHVDVNPTENSVTAFLNTVSPWIVYDLAETAAMLPPQVWTRDPRDGFPWENTAEITSFDPSALAYPTVYNVNPGPISLPTQLFGTGPFILQHSTTFIDSNGYADLDANIAYMGISAEAIADMFYTSGDVNYDGRIDISDLNIIATYFQVEALYGDWDGQDPSFPWDIDIFLDGIIDIRDLVLSGKYFGETRCTP